MIRSHEIVDVQTTLLTGPCTNDPYMQAAREVRSAAFVEVTLADGTVGIGETYAGYFFPECVPSLVDFFSPILIGQTVDDIDQLWNRMYHCGNFWCRVGLGLAVLNGIEAALWDARGKLEGKPVYELLGSARHASLPCYATGGPSNYPLETLAEKVEHYVSLGFTGVKLGVGGLSNEQGFFCSMEPSQAADFEAEKLAFIRQRFGGDLTAMLDGHMGNSPSGVWDVEAASAVVRSLGPFKLFFLEEPLHYTDVSGYAQLRATSSIPIAGGEALTGVAEWRTFIERECFDIGQPDASFTGGLLQVLEVARLLAEQGRTIATHAWGAGGSLMQNIHCGFAASNTAMLEIPPDFGPLHAEIVGESFRMEAGRILPPQTPGLGVTLTEDLKRRFPFVPGSGEFNSVPGKIMPEEQTAYATQDHR